MQFKIRYLLKNSHEEFNFITIKIKSFFGLIKFTKKFLRIYNLELFLIKF